MIDPQYLRDIVRISLVPLKLWSQDAEELLLMTAAHESHMGKYTRQIKGPALGIYQMEPGTLNDNYKNYLNYPAQKKIRDKILNVSGVNGADRGHLQFNPIYSTIHARIKYRRSPAPLPNASDPWALAEYAKDIFNTRRGKATPADYYNAYREFVLS